MATWDVLTLGYFQQNASQPFFSVTDTVGDDSTDAHPAIQAAVNAAEAAGGGRVLIPAGVFRVSESIVMNDDNVTLQGCGRSATVLKTLGDFQVIKWQSASGLCVRDLQLLGDDDSGKTSQRGIEVITVSDSLIHNVHVKDMGYDGLCMLRGSIRNTISNCLVEGCDDDGINIGGSTLGDSYDNVIVGNVVKGSANTGIHLSDGSSSSTVTGNLIVDCGEDGINTFQTDTRVGQGNNTITGNTIRDCADFGIHIRDSDHNVVSGNNIHGGLRSLRADNTSHSVFSDNRCEDATISSFLDDTDCSDLTIANNVCSGSAAAILTTSPRAVIEGNSVRGVTGISLQVAATGVDSVISDNVITSTTTNSIAALAPGCVVSGNRLVGGTTAILTASTSVGCCIMGNIVSGAALGVHVIGADCVVSGNVLTTMSSHGIRVDSTATDCVVSGNSLKTITSNGVYLNAAVRAHVVGNKINAANVGISIAAGVDCHVADNSTVASVTASISENGASSATTVVHNRFDGTTTVNGTGSVLIKPTKSSAYTPTNVTTDRAYDANSTDVAELADVLGTLIADLKSNGIIG